MAGNLHTGHSALSLSHGSMHMGWKWWKHGIMRTCESSSSSQRQIGQLVCLDALSILALCNGTVSGHTRAKTQQRGNAGDGPDGDERKLSDLSVACALSELGLVELFKQHETLIV